MIQGMVNANIEAIVRLVIAGPNSQDQPVDAVIDTGFSGSLTLPPAIIAALQLAWLGREEGTLADGSVDLFDVYLASVLWDGHARVIEIEAVNAQPLLGMDLLRRHSLHIEVVNGGAISITALP